MEEIHFVGTNSPTNIYGSCIFHCFGRTTVVVGSRKNVQLISPTTTSVGVLQWITDDLQTPYFSTEEDEITAVDCFIHSQTGFPVVSVCGVRGEKKGGLGFFGIHVGNKSTASKDLFYEFGRSVIELSFKPLYVTHAEVQTVNGVLKAFIISGTDDQIHLFIDDVILKEYREVPLNKYFPEIVQISSGLMCMDIQYTSNQRIIALGYQNGFIAITAYDDSTKSVVYNITKMLDGPISCLKFYCPDYYNNYSDNFSKTKPNIHPALEDFDKYTKGKNTKTGSQLNIIIGGALGYAMAFKDILNANLDRWEILPYPQSSDSVTSVCIVDWDMDRQLEVCVGSYGKQVHIFKEYGNTKTFKLAGRFNFSQPVESILSCHFTQDGVLGLLVSCFKGVHFIRPKFSIVKNKIDEGLKLLQEKRSLERLLKEEMDQINILKAQLGES